MVSNKKYLEMCQQFDDCWTELGNVRRASEVNSKALSDKDARIKELGDYVFGSTSDKLMQSRETNDLRNRLDHSAESNLKLNGELDDALEKLKVIRIINKSKLPLKKWVVNSEIDVEAHFRSGSFFQVYCADGTLETVLEIETVNSCHLVRSSRLT